MLAVSRERRLIQLACAQSKHLWWHSWVVKRIFEYVKDLFLGSTLQKCLAPAVKFVILMAQIPSANIVGLRVSEKFIRSSSVLAAVGK